MFCPLNKALPACFHSHYFLILWHFLLTKTKKQKHYATHFGTCCSVVKSCLLFVTPWTVARQAPLSFSLSWSSLKSISIESVMLSDHLIFCFPFLLLPSVSSSIRVFSNELALLIGWPKYWSFSFSISPSNEYSGLISFRMDWFHLLAVQGTLKSLL